MSDCISDYTLETCGLMFLSLSRRFIQEDGNVTVDVNVFDGIVPGKLVSITEKRANLLEVIDEKGENVALGKQTKVSSTFPFSGYNVDGYIAGSALDGNPDTFFHSNGGSSSADEYFQVDLGQNYRVGR